MYIRWLRAFDKSHRLLDSIKFEFSRPMADEVACEKLQHGASHVWQSHVGLLVAPEAVVKVFSGDCWSIPAENSGRLIKTMNPRVRRRCSRLEAWAHPVYTGLVLDVGFSELDRRNQDAVVATFNSGVLIYRLKDGKLHPLSF